MTPEKLSGLGSDAVALGLELGDLGARPVERTPGTLAKLIGLGATLGDEGQRLLAGLTAVLGCLGPAAGDLLGNEGAQAGGTRLRLRAAPLEASHRTLGLVRGVGDDAGGLGLGPLAGGRRLALHLGGRQGGDLGDVVRALPGLGELECHPSGDSGDHPLQATSYAAGVRGDVRVAGAADRVGLAGGTLEDGADRGGRPLGLLGSAAQLVLALQRAAARISSAAPRMRSASAAEEWRSSSAWCDASSSIASTRRTRWRAGTRPRSVAEPRWCWPVARPSSTRRAAVS